MQSNEMNGRAQAKIAELEKEFSSVKAIYERMKNNIDLASASRMIQTGQFLLETFATVKDIEGIYIQKNAESGIENAETGPTVLLTTLYPNVRIPHNIKIAVESEAIVHAGKMKSSTALYRI